MSQHSALVADGMAVVQSIKETPAMRGSSDFHDAFVARIEEMLIRIQ